MKPFQFTKEDKDTLVSILESSPTFNKHYSSLVVEAFREILPNDEVIKHSASVSNLRADSIFSYLGNVTVPGGKPAEILFLEAFMKEIGSKDQAYEGIMGVLRNYDGRSPMPPAGTRQYSKPE